MSDYEKPLIDACLTDKKSLYRVVGELKPDDFESNVCQKAFITISNLVKEGKPVTITTLCDQVKSIPPDLFTPNHINGEELEYFISKVKEQGKGRQLKRIIAQCQDITEREEMGIDEKIQLVQDVILSSFGNSKKEEMSTQAIGDLVLKMYEEKK